MVGLNIGLNLYGIPHFSYMGAALTTLITEAVLMIYTVVVAWREFEVRFDWPVMIRLSVASLATLAVTWYYRTLLVGQLSIFATHGKLWQASQLGLTSALVAVVFIVFVRVAFIGSKAHLQALVDLR